MLTISADISELSQLQREALSGFILSYPEVERRVKVVDVAVERLAAETAAEEELSPEAAFGRGNDSESPSSTNDKSGLPWDERIHASSKALTADGCWRKKRGVSDALVAEVESQLKQLMAIPSPATTIPNPPVIVATSGLGVVPPPPPPIVDQKEARAAFIHLVGRVSKAIGEKIITNEEVQAICVKRGIPSLQLVVNRFDLLPDIEMDIEALIISR